MRTQELQCVVSKIVSRTLRVMGSGAWDVSSSLIGEGTDGSELYSDWTEMRRDIWGKGCERELAIGRILRAYGKVGVEHICHQIPRSDMKSGDINAVTLVREFRSV